jgi:hypothetical protein
MVHSLQDLMAGRFDAQPPEIQIIKDFVLKEFDEDVAVAMQTHQVTISVRSSALAGALRPHLYKIKKLCNTEKRLVIRIG